MIGSALLIGSILIVILTTITGWTGSRGLSVGYALASVALMAVLAVVTQTDAGVAIPSIALSAVAFPIFQRRKIAAALAEDSTDDLGTLAA